jgi:hypothetical protein
MALPTSFYEGRRSICFWHDYTVLFQWNLSMRTKTLKWNRRSQKKRREATYVCRKQQGFLTNRTPSHRASSSAQKYASMPVTRINVRYLSVFSLLEDTRISLFLDNSYLKLNRTFMRYSFFKFSCSWVCSWIASHENMLAMPPGVRIASELTFGWTIKSKYAWASYIL